jgi:hypothetical protein
VEEVLSLKKMLAMSWLYLGVLVVGAWVLHSWTLAWAVLAGGVLSVVSFWVTYRDVAGFIEGLSGQADGTTGKNSFTAKKKGLFFKFWLRIALIGIVLLLLIKMAEINVFGLILGLTTVVFTIIVSGLGMVWRYYFSRR